MIRRLLFWQIVSIIPICFFIFPELNIEEPAYGNTFLSLKMSL